MSTYLFSALIISLSGAFGGIVLGIVNRTSYSICIPGGKLIPLGFFADALIGCAAALSIFSFVGSIINIDFTKLDDPQNIVKIIAIGVLSGFAGISLLKKMSKNLLQRVDDLDNKIEKLTIEKKSNEFVERGVVHARVKDYELANEFYDHALEIDPNNTRALVNKGFALKKMGKVKEALTCAQKATLIDPVLATALYNSACYKTLLDYPKNEILQDLKQAFNEIKYLKKVAKKDEDFIKIKKDEDFQSLVDF